MGRFGVIADTHIRPAGAAYAYATTVKNHLAYALNYLNGLSPVVEQVFFGGDLCHPDGISPPYPEQHVNDSCYEEFLSVVNANWTKPYHAIPGNHDCPFEVFFRYFDPLPKYELVTNINAVLVPAYAGVQSYASGWCCSWYSRRTLDWLKNTLPNLAAPRVIILHQVPINLPEIKTQYQLPYFIKTQKGFGIWDTLWSKSEYWIPMNAPSFIKTVSGKCEAVITGHLWQFTSEGKKTVDTVDVVYQKHFIKDDTGARHTILDVYYDGTTLKITSHDLSVSPPTTTVLLSKAV